MRYLPILFTLVLSSRLLAGGTAVQWTEGEGGNGHWYQGILYPGGCTSNEAQAAAESMGGHLATLATEAEDSWVRSNPASDFSLWANNGIEGPWIGAVNYSDAWEWVDGTSWSYANWWPGNPGDCCPADVSLWEYSAGRLWQDHSQGVRVFTSYLVEWSADCNGDGIVDYGQIQDGIFEDVNQNGIPDCCDQDEPCDFAIVPDDFPTIQQAIDAAESGSEILVRPGHYPERLTCSKSITLRSMDGADTTIIDGEQAGTVMVISGGQPDDWLQPVIDGFTIANGASLGAVDTSGGIYVYDFVDLVLKNSILRDNTHSSGEYGGGAIKVSVSSLHAENCVFTGNQAAWSGASIYFWVSLPSTTNTIVNCIFEYEGYTEGSDHAPLDVLHLQQGASATVTGCIFRNNHINVSEIMVWEGCSATVRDCIFQDPDLESDIPGNDGEGSVVSGLSASLTSSNLLVCEHPEPFVTISHDDQGGSLMHSSSCDCNDDGLLDFDQVADGTYVDVDGNGIPDCCDGGSTCDSLIQNAVQWTKAGGGNGNWYGVIQFSDTVDWYRMRDAAEAFGGRACECIDEC